MGRDYMDGDYARYAGATADDFMKIKSGKFDAKKFLKEQLFLAKNAQGKPEIRATSVSEELFERVSKHYTAQQAKLAKEIAAVSTLDTDEIKSHKAELRRVELWAETKTELDQTENKNNPEAFARLYDLKLKKAAIQTGNDPNEQQRLYQYGESAEQKIAKQLATTAKIAREMDEPFIRFDAAIERLNTAIKTIDADIKKNEDITKDSAVTPEVKNKANTNIEKFTAVKKKFENSRKELTENKEWFGDSLRENDETKRLTTFTALLAHEKALSEPHVAMQKVKPISPELLGALKDVCDVYKTTPGVQPSQALQEFQKNLGALNNATEKLRSITNRMVDKNDKDSANGYEAALADVEKCRAKVCVQLKAQGDIIEKAFHDAGVANEKLNNSINANDRALFALTQELRANNRVLRQLAVENHIPVKDENRFLPKCGASDSVFSYDKKNPKECVITTREYNQMTRKFEDTPYKFKDKDGNSINPTQKDIDNTIKQMQADGANITANEHFFSSKVTVDFGDEATRGKFFTLLQKNMLQKRAAADPAAVANVTEGIPEADGIRKGADGKPIVDDKIRADRLIG